MPPHRPGWNGKTTTSLSAPTVCTGIPAGTTWSTGHLFATLVTHYWAHDAFLAPSILERMNRLAGVPATLIHGRRDISGPAVIPWLLHQAWPGSELIIDEGEGHGGNAMVEAWTAANIRHAGRISPAAG